MSVEGVRLYLGSGPSPPPLPARTCKRTELAGNGLSGNRSPANGRPQSHSRSPGEKRSFSSRVPLILVHKTGTGPSHACSEVNRIVKCGSCAQQDRTFSPFHHLSLSVSRPDPDPLPTPPDPSTPSHCHPDQFMCDNKGCISEELVCDFKADCSDGADERHCGKCWHKG